MQAFFAPRIERPFTLSMSWPTRRPGTEAASVLGMISVRCTSVPAGDKHSQQSRFPYMVMSSDDYPIGSRVATKVGSVFCISSVESTSVGLDCYLSMHRSTSRLTCTHRCTRKECASPPEPHPGQRHETQAPSPSSPSAAACEKRHSFLESFPYVCPEPVLVK